MQEFYSSTTRINFSKGKKLKEKENYEIFNFKLKRASISQFFKYFYNIRGVITSSRTRMKSEAALSVLKRQQDLPFEVLLLETPLGTRKITDTLLSTGRKCTRASPRPWCAKLQIFLSFSRFVQWPQQYTPRLVSLAMLGSS